MKVECIRLASRLLGGADRLDDVVCRAIALAIPRHVSSIFLDTLQRQPRTIIPSPSLIRRYYIALDMALCLCCRERRHEAIEYRYAHTDSSPMAGFDWLWSPEVIIQHSGILKLFAAVCKLSRGIADLCNANRPLPDSKYAQCHGEDAWRMEPLQHELQ